MSNPIGSGIVAALALSSAVLAGGNGDENKNGKKPPPAPAPQEPGATTVTAAAGDGITFKGDNFKLNLANRIQVNFGYTNTDNAREDTLGVRVRRARTKLEGSAYKDTVHFLMQFEWADSQTNDIVDALITWDFYKSEDYEMALLLGQAKTLFGTEATGSSGGLEFIDRAVATQLLANTRSRQAQVMGKLGSGHLRWNAGLLNNDVSAAAVGAGEDGNNASTELNWILGVAYGTGQDEIYYTKRKQGAIKRAEEAMWVANASIHYGNNDRNDVAGIAYDAVTLNGGGALWVGGMHFLADLFVRTEDAANGALAGEANALGWQASGSYTMEPGPSIQWGFGLRFSGVHVTGYDANAVGPPPILATGLGATGLGGEGNIFEFSAVASAYYFGHNLKTQFGYTFRMLDPDTNGVPDPNSHTLELQSQIVF